MEPDKSALQVQAAGLTTTRFREATDVANVCKEIVKKTAVSIGERNYVRVEGWTSIAVAHGCMAGIKEGSVVEVFRDGKVVGIKAVAEIKRQLDGMILSSAEGYVGNDEETWWGSHGVEVERYSKQLQKKVMRVIPKRDDYAIRSMAQTRAVAKACRNAFSHVVVLMDAGLSTTPAEEMTDPDDAVETTVTKVEEETKRAAAASSAGNAPPAPPKTDGKPIEVPRDEMTKLERQFEEGRWKEVVVHFGPTNKGKKLGALSDNSLSWYCWKWEMGKRGEPTDDDKILRAACNVAIAELGLTEPTR